MLSENTFVQEIKPTKMATKLNIKGNWDEMKGKLKQKYAILTDDEKNLVIRKNKYDTPSKNYSS
jgi:hypothetical protein